MTRDETREKAESLVKNIIGLLFHAAELYCSYRIINYIDNIKVNIDT